MTTQPAIDELFDRPITYPNVEACERLRRLVGLDDHKTRLAKMLGLLINPSGLEAWVSEYHPRANGLLDTVLRRPPLVVLAGDVGSGKSELAETIGDDVARREGASITLFPMSLSTRGQGRVGEMTQLLSAAFDHTLAEAQKLKGINGTSRGAVLLLVDEADAIAQSREASQMHHEDKAGVNAFIRGIDRLGRGKLPAAVIMCTNRLGALDPAVRRRAADLLTFTRPDSEQRVAVLAPHLHQLGFRRRRSRLWSLLLDDANMGTTALLSRTSRNGSCRPSCSMLFQLVQPIPTERWKSLETWPRQHRFGMVHRERVVARATPRRSARRYPPAIGDRPSELRASRHQGRCQRKRVVVPSSDLPSPPIPRCQGPRGR